MFNLMETSNRSGLIVEVCFHGRLVWFTVRFGSVRHKLRNGKEKKGNDKETRQD